MKDPKLLYQHLTGGDYYLEAETKGLEEYLKSKGWIHSEEKILRIEKPGEGNMNSVFRVILRKAAPLIAKQARPWVEKYPHLEAPVERIQVEYLYYQTVKKFPGLAGCSPEVLGYDAANSLLIMEDLGPSADYSHVYQEDAFFSKPELRTAINYLNQLKLVKPNDFPENLSLRKLNHQHIFDLPFRDNSFNLEQVQQGLEQIAERCKNDTQLIDQITELGEIYLKPGEILVQGDFYPGSLLKSATGLKVIDPEFSFIGPEEWDIGVFVAHLFLSCTPLTPVKSALEQFQKTRDFSEYRFAGFIGTEILRRLIGLAQLPLELTLEQKQRLTDLSIDCIKTGKIDTLSSYEDLLINS